MLKDSAASFAELQRRAEPGAAAAIERLVREAPDSNLCRINPLAFAAENGLGEQATVAALLHATQIGLFDLIWNVVCDGCGCGGVLHAASALGEIRQPHYHCSLCSLECAPVLDDRVEVSFTVAPQTREIAAHAPQSVSRASICATAASTDQSF